MNTAANTKTKLSKHESYATFMALAFLLPGVAFILGIAYMIKDDKLDKRLGEHTLVMSIIAGILWVAAYGVYGYWSANSAPVDLYRPY